MAKMTKTLNPLHFEDLEPHRFEDLIRQLAYDFRPWKRLEPTGRLGADDGIDIRGVEAAPVEVPDEDDTDEEEERPGTIERLWTIQCKREKSVHPADIKKIIKEAIPEGSPAPYGFILAAACDFSKKSRDTFIIELREWGVEEFCLWGKADLEDLLFLPKNDHLLFAYFGISLQIRRRTMRSEIRSRLATKKAVHSLLGGRDPLRFCPILVRDATVGPYSKPQLIDLQVEDRSIVFCNCIGDIRPDHLSFVVRRHLAFVDDQRSAWDAMLAVPDRQAYASLINQNMKKTSLDLPPGGQWEAFEEIGRDNQAWYNVIVHVQFDRIIALDQHGDCWVNGPHLFVEPHPTSGVFEPSFQRSLCRYPSGPWLAHADPMKTIEKFPPGLRGMAATSAPEQTVSGQSNSEPTTSSETENDPTS